MERGRCNCGQFRKSVDFLKERAGDLPTIPISDQDPARILHEDLWSRRLRGSALKSSRAWCLRQGRE